MSLGLCRDNRRVFTYAKASPTWFGAFDRRTPFAGLDRPGSWGLDMRGGAFRLSVDV